MAKAKSSRGRKKKSAKKAAKKKAARKAGKKRAAARRPKRAAARRPARRAPRKPAVPNIRDGVVTHTELASGDPTATRDWCETVLGWKFGEAMPTPAGPYHMWRFDSTNTGGGIRANNPPEVPGSIPYCEVADIQSTFARAISAGATEMMAPEQLPGGMGWIAIVAAPGGVAIGFWSMK